MIKKPKRFHKDWKKELARDFFSLGSWVFYILVLIRALIKPYRPFVDQIIIAAIVVVILRSFIHSDGYLARGLILAVFTSLFYQDFLFTIFAFLVLAGLIYASFILGRRMRSRIIGLIFGVIAVLIGYYVPNFY